MNRHNDYQARIPTPWGVSDCGTHYGKGIVFYSTPSHGGFFVTDEQLTQLHAVHGPVKTFCGCPEWFEEDCDWAYVATAFPDLFTADELEHAKATLAWSKQRQAQKEGAL